MKPQQNKSSIKIPLSRAVPFWLSVAGCSSLAMPCVVACGETNVPIGEQNHGSSGGAFASGGNKAVGGVSAGASSLQGGNSASGGHSAIGGSSTSQSGSSSKGGTSASGGAKASSGGMGGTLATGGVAATGGSANCSCVRGAFVPVCGTDGKSYDATCGDACVPVPVGCRGQCPCAAATGGSNTGGGLAGAPSIGGTTAFGGTGAGGTAATGGASGVSCWQNDAPFPVFDKSCTTKADCFIALHTVNCCGQKTAIGLNVTAQVSFDSAEAVCPAACTCVGGPTTAEDGQAVSTSHPTIDVMCSLNLCKTYIP